MRKTLITILVFLILVNIFYVISGVIHFPLRSIDVYSIWLYKAKAFFMMNGDVIATLRSMEYGHPQYPILLPFLYYQIYKAIGAANEFYVLFLYPGLYSGILFLSYKFFLKIGLNKPTSLFFVYLYSMFGPLLAQAGRMHAGTADIVILFFNWIIVLLAFKIAVEKRLESSLLIALLVAISSQVKLEGLFAAAIFLFLPLTKSKKLILILISILPTIIWFRIVNFYNIRPDFGFFIAGLGDLVTRTFIILIETAREMVNIRNWYVFWFLFWISLFAQKGKDRFLKTTVAPTLFIASFSFLASYLLADIDTRSYVSSSVDRLMLQLSPFFYVIFVERVTLIFRMKDSLLGRVLKRYY